MTESERETIASAMEPGTTSHVAPVANDLQSSDSSSPADAVSRLIHAVSQRQQHFLDKTVPYVLYRWIGCLFVVLIYAIRVYIVQGFYIITYAIGIYLLSLIVAFLSPQEDPEVSLNGGTLPIRGSDEFRPFARRLPEFKFWLLITRAFIIGFTATFFEVFDIPVFWPILLMYWIMLFIVTLRKQIQHMIKYKYVPISFGKQQQHGKKPPLTESSV